jgi:DNA polymerase-3 subunit epsilon
MIKEFIYDLETSGVNPHHNGIHQLAARIIVDGVLKEMIDIKMNPLTANKAVHEQALDVSKVSIDVVKSYQSYNLGFNELRIVLDRYINKFDNQDKFHLVGFNNIIFDDIFLRQFFLDNNHQFFGSYFWSNSIDTRVLAGIELRDKRHLIKSFSLTSVAESLGIDVDVNRTHEAGYDVELTHLIYQQFN